jgi:SagB-type dehydrogenase family enzyme
MLSGRSAAIAAVFWSVLIVPDTARAQDDTAIRLPGPTAASNVSLEEAFRARRSVREFGDGSLWLADVSQLLWAAQGITDPQGYRTAPSAGALYPLELYLLAGDVEDLSPGLYRYRARDHQLLPVRDEDLRESLAATALFQRWIAEAPAVLVLTAVYERTAAKYGDRAPRYVHMEVGHAAQNIYLQATARGLGTTFVGAFDDRRVSEALDLPADHAPLGVMPIGRLP